MCIYRKIIGIISWKLSWQFIFYLTNTHIFYQLHFTGLQRGEVFPNVFPPSEKKVHRASHSSPPWIFSSLPSTLETVAWTQYKLGKCFTTEPFPFVILKIYLLAYINHAQWVSLWTCIHIYGVFWSYSPPLASPVQLPLLLIPCIFCCAVLRCIVLYFFGSPASLIRVAYKNMGEELVKEAWETNQFLHKRKEISFPLPGTINCLYIFGERQGLRKPSPTFFPFQILRQGLNKLLGLDSVSLCSPASAS